MKWITRSLYVLLGLIALVAIGLTAFMVTFDANDYRGRIVEVVKTQTGRDLAIDGDIGLNLFSWRPALSLRKLSLSDAPGFGDRPFAELGSARVELQWLPLLTERSLEVEQVHFAGLRLRLARDAQGRANWADLAGAPAAPAAEPAPSGQPPAPDGGSPLAAFSLADLRIEDASIEWRDAQAGTEAEIRDFDLASGRLRLGEPFPLRFGFELINAEPALKARVDFEGAVTADPAAARYAVRDLALLVGAQGTALPVPALEARLGTDLQLDLAAGTARLSDLSLQTLGLDLSGQVEARSITATPTFDARIGVAAFDARALLRRLGQPPLETADPDALEAVSLDLAASGDLQAVKLSELILRLDQSTLQGRLDAGSLGSGLPVVRFELALDQLDADRYLPPPPPEPPTDAPVPLPPTAADEAPLPIPLDLLRQLDLQGRFTAGSLKIRKARMQDLELAVQARDGQVRIDPLTMNLYEGILRGNLALDARSDTPRVVTRLKLAGVRSEPLLNDVLDLDLVSGKADSEIELQTAGVRVSEFKRNLNGRLSASFTDGALKGFNLAGLLREAEARLQKRAVEDARAQRATDFAAMSVSARVVDGVLQTDDLDLRAPLLRLAGAGRVDLVESSLDYLARVTLTDKQTGQGGAGVDQLKGLTVPIRVSGLFTDPKVSVELAKALEQQARDALRNEAARAEAAAQRRLDEEKARLQRDLDANKARLQGDVDAEQARLAEQKAKAEADLKAKAEAEKARAAEKLKQNVGDQLKKLF